MSEELKADQIPELSHEDVHLAVADALHVGCHCDPDQACGATIARLTASFGPIVQKIVALIQSGLTNIPQILAALSAMGVVLPPWVGLVVQLLLAIVPKPAPAGA